jgi:hypothetical protein
MRLDLMSCNLHQGETRLQPAPHPILENGPASMCHFESAGGGGEILGTVSPTKTLDGPPDGLG